MVGKTGWGRFSAAVLLAAGFLVSHGCNSNSTTPKPPDPDCTSVADTNLVPTVSYQNDIFPLFAADKYNCNDSGCHGAPLISSDYSVSDYESLFHRGVEATDLGYCVIRPGDPDSSYFVWKIEGRSGIQGVRMPNSKPPMSQADIDLVRTWITEGALNN